MSKFKVGDMFRYMAEENGYHYYTKGKIYSITHVHEDENYQMNDNNSDEHWWSARTIAECFEQCGLITKPKSPVQERVVMEVVSGHYGNVTVYYINESLKADLRIELTKSKHSAQELRDAAETFLAIADYMEGK